MLVLGLFLPLVLYLLVHRLRANKNLPPGPKRWFLLGNALQIPLERTWLKFTEWAKQYGEVVYLDAAGQPIIILNSARAAKDLLDRRSHSYSDRPHLVMAGTLCGFDRGFAIMHYGSEFRAHRKIVAPAFTAAAVQEYAPIQRGEAVGLALDCLGDATELRDHVLLRVGRIIARIEYGYDIQSLEDANYSVLLRSMDAFIKVTSPGAFLVDFIPALRFLPRWFPGAAFLTTAKEYRELGEQGVSMMYDWCQTQLHTEMDTNSPIRNSVCGRRLLDHELDPGAGENETMKWAFGIMMQGGMDTNMSTLLSFFRLMASHVGIQEKAQEEIDGVCVKARLPTSEDQDALPFVRALLTEVLRTSPAAPLGLPHCINADDLYEGVTIPKGSIVIANIWNMLHDETVYEQPMEFEPERYEGSDEKMKAVHDLVFGFGRRSCPGVHLAESSFFAFASIILATCDILPAEDSDGKPTIPGMEFTSGTIVYPEAFGCQVRPRSAEHLELLNNFCV